jgi:hypothetical protein
MTAAPPVLLEIDRALWRSTFNAAQRGDSEANEAFRALWLEYTDIHCFTCNNPVPSDACYSEPLPHKTRADLVLVAPLCVECRNLTSQQRLHRVNKMLGRMWKHKNGSPMRFTYRTPWNR